MTAYAEIWAPGIRQASRNTPYITEITLSTAAVNVVPNEDTMTARGRSLAPAPEPPKWSPPPGAPRRRHPFR